MRRRFFTLCFLVTFALQVTAQQKNLTRLQGAIVRGDSTRKELALVFTADETGEGLTRIRKTLKTEGVKAGFFFTGRFYRNPAFKKELQLLKKEGHYLGPHSDRHLLYCDWNKRDSLLVTKDSFEKDLLRNVAAMKEEGLRHSPPLLFIPPFEWWNDTIASWSKGLSFTLFNFTPGIRTNADYTWPQLGAAYKSSSWILQWISESMAVNPQQWNGAIVLLHAGTDPRRRDKFYWQLKEVLRIFKTNGFHLKRIDDLLSPHPEKN